MSKKPITLCIRPPRPENNITGWYLTKRSGRKYLGPVNAPEVEEINDRYRAGRLTYEKAYDEMRQVRDKYYAKFRKPNEIVPRNEELIEEYWEANYEGREIKHPEAARARLERTLKLLGPVNLETATKVEIGKQIAKAKNKTEAVSTINAILKFLDRNIVFSKARTSPKQIKVLTDAEFQTILSHLDCQDPDTMRIICKVIYGTGLKLAELYALEVSSLRHDDKALYIDKQYTEEGLTDLDATTARIVPILETYRSSVIDWLNIPETLKRFSFNWDHGTIVKRAGQRAYPKDKRKHCTLTDLRDSFAVRLLQEGFDIDTTAKLLGVGIYYAKARYGSYEVAPGGIDGVLKKLSGE